MKNKGDAVSIIGSGFIGRVVGEGLSQLHRSVIFYDVEHKDLPGFTGDLDQAIGESDTSIICVPTPTLEDGSTDQSFLKDCVARMGGALKHKQRYHLIVVKSTVLPMTTESLIIPELERISGKKAGPDFGVCVNPEFITEISRTWSEDGLFARSFFNEDRIIIGEFDRRSGDLLQEIYKPLDVPVFRVDLKTAEMIKYAANCMLATKISYWNEMFFICRQMGIDSQAVATAASADTRIGRYGTVHGKAFGGRCLPKDLKALITFARPYHKPVLLESVQAINDAMRQEYGVRE